MRRSLAVVLLAYLMSSPNFGSWTVPKVQAQGQIKQTGSYAPDKILVKFRERASFSARELVRGRVGAKVIREYSWLASGLQLQELPPGISVEEALSILAVDPNVEYAEPDYVYTTSALKPNDTNYNILWGLENTGQSGGTPDIDIDAPEAWELATGTAQVVVGIIDTGIDYNHVDLALNMWRNTGEIAGNRIDDDGNGFVDDVHGWNAGSGNGDPFDDNDHGTHVAGTIGAVGNNSAGVAGVNWTVKLMALKFLDADGSGYVSDAVECISYAIAMKNRGVNIRVLNASWGGAGFSSTLRNAIQSAGDAGMVFVAAAGNNGDGSKSRGTDNDVSPLYPASYDLSNIITVAAVDRRGEMAAFSNYGPASVDLAAPGVSIASTVPSNGYALFSGTSMATPHVSGVAALLLSANPTLSVEAMKTAIFQGVTPLAAVQGKTVTGGLLNAFNSIQLVRQAPPPPSGSSFEIAFSFVPTSIKAGESATLGIAVSSVNGFAGSVALSSQITPEPGGTNQGWSQNPVTVPANGSAPATLTVATSSATTPGSYTLIVQGTSGEHSKTASLTLTIEPSSGGDPGPPGDDPSGFSLTVSPASRVVRRGSMGMFTINVNRVDDYEEPVALQVLSRGSGQGLSLLMILPNPVVGNRATLVMRVSSSASRRTEAVFVRGVDRHGRVQESNDFVLDIR